MNQAQNNLNPNSFNTQGNNGIPNNQGFNQDINQDANVNQQMFNQQPIMQESIPQPTNTFDSGSANNQSLNGKPPKKTNLGLIIGIVAVVAVVGVGIVFGSKLLSNDRDNNSETNANENIPINHEEEEKIGTNTWGITFNGEIINFPCLLEDLTNVGVTLKAEEHYDKVINSANTEFVVLLAGNENWPDEIVLSLRTKDDISKKEANVVVTNIQLEVPRKNMLTKEQFHLKGDIYLGSTKAEIISVFGDNYTVVSEVDHYSHITYDDEESELHLYFKDNALNGIQIWKKQ